MFVNIIERKKGTERNLSVPLGLISSDPTLYGVVHNGAGPFLKR